jgi:hypothetical protein
MYSIMRGENRRMSSPAVPPGSIFFWVAYKPEEINNAYWAVYKRLALPRNLISVFCFASLLGAGGVASNLDSLREADAALLLPVVGLVIPAVLCVFVFLLIRGRLAKSFEARPNFHFPLTYLIDPVGMQIQYASGAGLLEWRHFILAIEDPTAFILASNVDDVFVLPKRCLESEAEVNAARNYIQKHVRNFVRGRGRQVEIAFEKAAIQRIIVDGIEQVIEAAESNHTSSLSDSDISKAQSLDKNLEIASGRMASPLKPGLALEVAYQKGEIQSAELVYFFRTRLPALARFYIIYLLWLPGSFLAIGYVWGALDYCLRALKDGAPAALLILPLFAFHALAIFMYVRKRTLQNEQFAIPFIFQFSEEGCGIRAGERYAVLAWWHFKECWETEEQFLLLVGKRSQAMYVVPKRILPDRISQAYLKGLLERKVKRYRDLID